MKDSKQIKKHCLNSISFIALISIKFISESVSIVMNVLLLVMTSWNYLKKANKILNIISLSFIAFIIFLNIILACSLKNIKQQIFQKYSPIKVFLIFLIIFYILIIIFNIYDAVYLSIRLHIADYPEYGGRKRDQIYIDTHPNEFGNVPLKEFIIVAICPSVICVLNLLCIIISILIRNKLLLTYNKEKERLGKREDKEKSKNKNHKNKNKKRNSVTNYKSIIKSNDELINTNNNTAENYINMNSNKNINNEVLKIKINNSDDGNGYENKLPRKYFSNIKFETNESINNDKKDIKEYIDELPRQFFFGEREVNIKKEKKESQSKEQKFEEPKKIIFNSMQGTKSTIDYKNKK